MDGFVGLQALAFDLLAAAFDDLAGLGFLVGLHLVDGSGLLGGVLLVASALFALGDVGVGVLLLDLHLRALGKFVGAYAFTLGDLGDLPDALGIEDVAGVMLVERGLFEVVDGDVLQEEAVEILADGRLDFFAELDAFREQFVEFHLFAGGLEGFGELRLEQFAELGHVGHALDAEHLGDFLHAFHGRLDADVEGHGDVGADVVLADEAVLALAVDLQLLHGDVHLLEVLHDGDADHVVERDAQAAEADADAGLAGMDLADADHDDDREDEQDKDDSCGDDEGWHRRKSFGWGLGLAPSSCLSSRRPRTWQLGSAWDALGITQSARWRLVGFRGRFSNREHPALSFPPGPTEFAASFRSDRIA